MSQSGKYNFGGGPTPPIITIDGDVGSAVGPIITFLGASAGSSVQFNAAVSTVLFEVTDAGGNTIIGNGAGNGTLTGTSNTALGKDALDGLTTGISNIAIGYQAMAATTTGSSNIVIGGGGANSSILGSNNIIIGNPSAVPGAISNETVIGNDTTNKVFISGIDGVNVGSVARVVTEFNSQLGTANITAGTGISVTPGANVITIAATGAGSFSWSVITVNQTAAVNKGYICNKAGTLALALPASSSVGDVIEVTNENTALGVQFTQSAGQQILIGNSSSTSGATGTITSSALGDTLKIVCITANLTWRVTSGWGNWTPA